MAHLRELEPGVSQAVPGADALVSPTTAIERLASSVDHT